MKTANTQKQSLKSQIYILQQYCSRFNKDILVTSFNKYKNPVINTLRSSLQSKSIRQKKNKIQIHQNTFRLKLLQNSFKFNISNAYIRKSLQTDNFKSLMSNANNIFNLVNNINKKQISHSFTKSCINMSPISIKTPSYKTQKYPTFDASQQQIQNPLDAERMTIYQLSNHEVAKNPIITCNSKAIKNFTKIQSRIFSANLAKSKASSTKILNRRPQSSIKLTKNNKIESKSKKQIRGSLLSNIDSQVKGWQAGNQEDMQF